MVAEDGIGGWLAAHGRVFSGTRAEKYIPKKACHKEIILIMGSVMQQMHLSKQCKCGRQALLFVKLNVQQMV
jgi:hypothetical protein